MTELKLGLRNLNQPEHWQLVPDNFSWQKKKNILAFAGNQTFSQSRANGFCKIVERVAFPELNTDPEQMMRWVKAEENNPLSRKYLKNIYAPHTEETFSKETYKRRCIEHQKSQYYRNKCNILGLIYNEEWQDKQYARGLWAETAPLVASPYDDKWIRRSLSHAAHNMRHFVGVTHCFGGNILMEYDNLLYDFLKCIGYSDTEANIISRQQIYFHQGNLTDETKIRKLHGIHIFRLTRQDEEFRHVVYPTGSVMQAIKKTPLPDDEPVLFALAPHQYILLVEKRANWDRNFLPVLEHDKGYWLADNHDFPKNQNERAVFKALLYEATRTNYLIKDSKHFIENTIKHHPQIKPYMQSLYQRGLYYRQKLNIARNIPCISFSR